MCSKRVVIIAGEVSGDHHAALFIEQLKHHDIHFSGMGGQRMKEAGVEIIHDLTKLGITGVTEVIKHIKQLKQVFKQIKHHLLTNKPDLLILVDYPGFNLRLAKYAKSIGIKVLYYISPQIWAWKKGRIHTIKKVVDMMAVILPFEKSIYQQAGVPVRFVGHPLIETLKPKLTKAQARKQFNLNDNSPVIALLPGSRQNELNRLLPTLLESVAQLPANHYQFIMPIAQTLNRQAIENTIKSKGLAIKLVDNQAVEVMNCCDSAIVASGTASLECALLQKPMAIIYKTTPITYMMAAMLIQVQYLGLCNLLANSMIVPELIQSDCNTRAVVTMIKQLTENPALINGMKENLAKIKHSLSNKAIDCSIATLTLEQLNS